MTLRSRTPVLLAAALALTGCSGPSPPPPVFVGHVATHSDQAGGAAAARGIRLAVLEANKDPDKGAGRQVKVIHTDTLGNLEAFEAEAVRLVAINRVAALLGGTTVAEVDRLELARVVVVSPCGTVPRSGSDIVFCTGLSPAYRGKVLARFAVDELKAHSATVLADERREDSVRLAEAFARELPLAAAKNTPKGAVPHPLLLRFGKDDAIKEVVGRLKEEKPGLLLFAGEAADLRRLRQELRGATVPVLFGGDEGSLRALQEDRDTNDKVYLVTAYAAGADAPRAQEFAKQFKATFGDEPDVRAALAYDDARLLFEGMRQTKENLTGARLREELAKLKDFPGLTGPLSFGEDRRLRRPAFVVQLKEGRAATVKRYGPEE